MTSSVDYWRLISGLGLFLLGMTMLEDTLKELAGRKFKLFLKKYTTNRAFAIINGAAATALLQSSSIVLLMVIAFAGAGIITLTNALGIILGANLGTTLTGWLVTILGFKTQMETFIFPLVGIGSLGLVLTSRRFLFYHLFGFLLAFGLILLGLNFMKEGVVQLETVFDISRIANLGYWAYFVFGLLVTAVIQSSSAMMTITLSALNANIITLTPAAFIVIGADLGTTMTALVASFKGTPVKKRVGLAHFFFNLITALFTVISFNPMMKLISGFIGISDPLLTLVAFHSGFNLIGIILFMPFLGFFEKFLNNFFKNNYDKACASIHKVSPEVPDAALEAVRSELDQLLRRVLSFNSRLVGLSFEDVKSNQQSGFLKYITSEEDLLVEYNRIKKVEDELLEYLIAIQKEKLDTNEVKLLNRYILVIRNAVQSAKSIKDIQHNLTDFHQSVIEIVESATNEIRREYQPVIKSINQIWKLNHQSIVSDEIIKLSSDNNQAFLRINKWIYGATQHVRAADQQVATFLNVNREIFSSNQLLIEALENVLSPIGEIQQ